MFKRGNVIAKYKQYIKSLKSLQIKSSSHEPITNVNKYERISNSIKSALENKKILSNESRVLSIIHNAINERITKSKENLSKVPETWRNSRLFKTSVFSAATVPIVKADTVSGYSSQDYELLKQLGIIPNDSKLNITTNSTLETTNEISITANDSASSSNDYHAFDSNSADISNSSNIHFPSLLEQQNYPSIFDNMPEERNDLYTTFNKIFSFTSDQATQFAESDLSVSEPLITSNKLDSNDYFVIETPGAESSNDVNTNELLVDVAPASPANEDLALGDINIGGDGTNELLTNSIPKQVGDISEAMSASQITNNMNSSTSIGDNIIVEAIPEPPTAPDLAAEAASQLNALGESTFASLGLGGYTPVGIVQNCFEYLHVGLGIPWWEAIAIGTLVIRFAMFPLVIMAQRNAAKMNNHLPQMQVIQLKMTEARQSGNQMEVARYSQELMMFMKEKNLNPFKNMIVPLAQMPVFISFFVGLRQMANVPVESLRTGGMFWFTDLTVPDQFFALPIITSLTLWATIELGTDSARLSSQNLQTMKYVLRALPFVILPFTVNFPGAILCYWVASNFISLGQVGFLKIPAVRDYFNIDPMLKHDSNKLPIQNKGFVGGLKDSWTNIKITKELEERRRLDDLQFQRAGKGPLVKTYKYDPTKQVKQVVNAKGAIKSS